MKTFRCPKCKDVQRALAKEVTHQCPANNSKVTNYEEVGDEG